MMGSRGTCYFNPRTPCGVRLSLSITPPPASNFNPRTPCGVRPIPTLYLLPSCTFQSTHPVRGATMPCSFSSLACVSFQSTHPVRGATVAEANLVVSLPISIHAPRAGCDGKFDDFNPLNLHKRHKRVLDRPKSTSEQGKNKAKLAYIHVFTVFWGGAKVPELSARFYFAPNTVRLSARPWRHSPLWHRNARCGCDTYPQGSKSADCLRIHP